MSADFPKRFGWVGLGAMGFPMASQLLKKLHPSEMFIYDLDDAILQKFVEANSGPAGPTISIVSSPKEAAENSECFISIVPEGSHVKEVYMTPERGALACNTAGKLFIDCSTIDVKSSLEVGRAVNASHPTTPRFFDAPVSGGTLGAQKGTLTFMVGVAGEDPLFPLLQRIFSSMGVSIYPLGGPSLGLAAKLSNNYLSSMITIATSEAMNLAMRLGLDPKVFSDCLKTSSGGNWTNSTMNPVPGVSPDAAPSKGYEGGFKIQLMKKDLKLAIQAAQEVNAKLVLADAGLGAYTAAVDDPNCRGKDARVVYRWLGGIEPEVRK